MGFDADMRKVKEHYQKWADASVITPEAFSAVEGMLNYLSDARSKFFDELESTLKRDRDIQSPWDSVCDKALSLLDSTNSSMSNKIPDGFRGLGMSDFYEGEKKAWQACKSGRIGLMAEVIFEIGKNDVEILKKLEEDLKKAREDAKVCDELARGTFGEVKETVRTVVAEVASMIVATPIAMIEHIGKVLVGQSKKTVKSMITGSASLREIGKKKKAARHILVSNAAMIDKAREQLGDGNIRNIRAECEKNANSWKDAASSGFKSDWESFARACCEVLKNKESPVLEKANNLYQVMRPNYMEAIKTSFVSLMSDPSTFAKFNGELDDDTKKMFDELAKEFAIVASLRVSDPTKLARQQMKEIVDELQNSLKELKKAIEEQEELMKS